MVRSTVAQILKKYLAWDPRHLVNSHEILGAELITLHNIHFFVNLVKSMREKIRKGRFLQFKKEFLNRFNPHTR